jgi:serine/threonine-protein kinase
LVNISPDPDNEYLCDGLSEELINGLTQIRGLRVVSRSSSFQCKGTTPDVREIGRRLGASYLVHGSLRRSGTSLRLTVQLSQTAEGYQIWSHRFDARTGDLFSLQDQLTDAVLEKLREQLGAQFPDLATQRLPASEAYDLYLKARFAFNRETPADFRTALDLFTRSTLADPSFAPAFVGIAEARMRLEWYGLERASESAPAVKAALAAAARLQPESVAQLCNLAITQAGWDWDWTAAGQTFARALAVGGANPTVHFHYGLDFLTPQGRLEEALSEQQLALQLDPLSAIVHTAIGGCLYRMRRFDEAEKTLRETIQANPNFGHGYWSLGRVLLEQGKVDEALQRFEQAAGMLGRIPAAQAELGYCYARMGRRDLAHCTIQELQRLAEQEWVSPLHEALVYAGLGEQEAALRRLESALQMRIRQLIWINVDPRYDGLRQNQGFVRLIRSLGLAPMESIPESAQLKMQSPFDADRRDST